MQILAVVITVLILAVITISLLKRRSNKNGQNYIDPKLQQDQHDSRQNLLLNKNATKLCFGKSEAAPLVEFSELKERDLPRHKNLIDPLSTKLAMLNPVLQLIPSILSGAQFGGSHYMRVVVNGPLALARDAHTFLPFVRGANGKVIELARLQNAQLCQVANAAKVWQFASVIVAQKHLADISDKLSQIKRGIDSIKAFLENARKAAITGNLRYLNQAVQAIRQGEFPTDIKDQLQHMERELLQIEDHLMDDLRSLAAGIGRIEHSDWVGTGELTQNIEKHQLDMYSVEQQWVLCVLARAANRQILSTFPGEEHSKMTRKDQILESLEELTGFLPEMYDLMQKKIAGIDSLFNRSETLRERQGKLACGFREQQDSISSSVAAIRTQVSEVADRFLLLQKPIVLALKVEHGEILKAYELDAVN